MKDYLYETYKDSWKPGDEVSDEMLDTLWNYAMVEVLKKGPSKEFPTIAAVLGQTSKPMEGKLAEEKKDEHQDKVYDSRLKKLEKKISILEKRMEPIEEVYFYLGDYGFGSEKSSQEVASVDKRIEQLERKQQWLEKRMLNLEYQCYSKAMKGVPSEEEVSSEDEFCTAKDVANEVISVSTEEDELTPIISRPSTSKRSIALKGQPASTSIAEDVPKISRPSTTHKRGRASISTPAPAPKRPRGRPPSSSKTGGQKKKAPSTSSPTGKASNSTAAPAPKRPRGRPPSSSKTGGQKKKGPSQAPPSSLAPTGKRPPPMTGVVIGLRARDAPPVLWF